eukprot:gene30765-7093_t
MLRPDTGAAAGGGEEAGPGPWDRERRELQSTIIALRQE